MGALGRAGGAPRGHHSPVPGGTFLDSLAAISELVRRRAGLVFSEARRTSLKIGVDRAFERSGLEDQSAWLERLRKDPDLLDDLLIELTVGETFFFRDPQHFDRLRDEALPELLAQRDPGHVLKFWSAGCATGEEPWSMAMLLADLGLLGRASVLGTDISRLSLSRAERGVYRPWSLRGDGRPRALRHLQGDGDRYEVPARLRDRVRFEYLNLAGPGWPSFGTGAFGLDVIFCRNVLIYFGPDTIHEVLSRFAQALLPGGWLVLGPSDPLATDHPDLETLMRPEGLFYRRRSGEAQAVAPAPRPALTAHPQAHPPAAAAKSPWPRAAPEAPPALKADLASLRETPAAAPPAALELAPEEAALVRIRTLANRDLPGALTACVEAVERHPVSAPLHFLLAVLLSEVGRLDEAREEARRALYLDGTLEVVQLFLGTLFRRQGAKERALAAFERAAELAGRRPDDEKVPLGEGATAAQLREAALTAASVIRRGEG